MQLKAAMANGHFLERRTVTMQLSLEEHNTLCNLYDAQETNVDRLGGTDFLTTITNRFNATHNKDFSKDQVLTKLISMRKSGMLTPKFVREPSERPKPTWPKLKHASEVRSFPVPVILFITRDAILGLLFSMTRLEHEPMPVTRQEVYDFLQVHPRYACIGSGWLDSVTPDHLDRIVATTDRLFPELL